MTIFDILTPQSEAVSESSLNWDLDANRVGPRGTMTSGFPNALCQCHWWKIPMVGRFLFLKMTWQ